MGEKKFDFNALPEFAKEEIAGAAWNAISDFMKRPDARGILDKEKERLLREGSTLLEPRDKLKGATT